MTCPSSHKKIFPDLLNCLPTLAILEIKVKHLHQCGKAVLFVDRQEYIVVQGSTSTLSWKLLGRNRWSYESNRVHGWADVKVVPTPLKFIFIGERIYMYINSFTLPSCYSKAPQYFQGAPPEWPHYRKVTIGYPVMFCRLLRKWTNVMSNVCLFWSLLMVLFDNVA